MVAASGLDFVFLDTEHIAIDRAQLSWMCAAYGALNLAPIVRVPEPSPYLACMALDGGAAGVVFPYVESIEQVKALRGAVKFRPLKGRRLRDKLDGKEELEPELAEYLAGWAAGKLMIVNIESIPALEALDEILAVPDLDALLIGPHDLSLNLGVPEQYAHPKFKRAVSMIIQKARAKNVGVGLHFSFGIDAEIEWAKEGANFIIHSSDFFLTRDAIAADLRKFKHELGERREKTQQAAPEEAI
jgi:4-hydroxy-2-oxoheptanedioate aldolase